MSARDEFLPTCEFPQLGGYGDLVEILTADYEAMCARIDTLTAELERVPYQLAEDALNKLAEARFERDALRAERDDVLAELRSLKAAVEDLRGRLMGAKDNLLDLAYNQNKADEERRLRTKAEGISLALDYMRSLPREEGKQ